MKKMKILKKVLLMALIFTLICSIGAVCKATDSGSDIDSIMNIQRINNNAVNNNVAKNVSNTNTNKNTNTSAALPKTGVNDTAVWVIIGVCTVAAIYTYKKVRDYNND